MKKIVIIGASGHGGMILECIQKEGKYTVLGFLDSYKKPGTPFCGLKILGNEQLVPELISQQDLYGVIIAIGNNYTRMIMRDRLLKIMPRIRFVSVVHPSAILSNTTEIGVGTIIMPGVIINSNSKIGDFCIVNTNASLGHDGHMEDFSSISPGVCTGGNLRLGEFSAISLGANVIENISIGTHCIIGAGSLVVSDIPDKTVAYGSPAKVIRSRNEKDPYLKGDRALIH